MVLILRILGLISYHKKSRLYQSHTILIQLIGMKMAEVLIDFMENSL